jgi:hypothetical protein
MPVLIILLALTAWPLRKNPKMLAQRFAILGAPLVLVNLPYIFYLAHPKVVIASTTVAPSVPHVKPPFDVADAAHTIVTTFLGPARVFTTAGISYFFDDAWKDFRTSLGLGALLLQGAWIALFLAAIAIAGLLVTLRKSDSPKLRKLALFASASWLGYALFLLIDGLDPHPHYQHPVWWTVPVGLALLFIQLRARSETRARVLIGGVWILALAQFSFLPTWMHYVRTNGGTRGTHYTTPLAEEQAWLRSACASQKDFTIANHTVIFDAALAYVASTDRACANHTVTICNGDYEHDPKTPTLNLTYANDVGGRLAQHF